MGKPLELKNAYFLLIAFALLNCSDKKSSFRNAPNSSDKILSNKSDKIDSTSNRSNLNAIINELRYHENDSSTRSKISKVALEFYKIQDWEDFKKSTTLLIDKSTESRDTLHLALAHRFTGNYYKRIFIYDSAFYHYLKAEKYYRELKDNFELGNILTNKSIVQFYASDYFGADRSITQAYTILRNYKAPKRLYEVYSMMGVIGNELRDYEKSLDYHKKALEIVKENNFNAEHEMATCFNNIGYAYQNSGKYADAISNYDAGLADKRLLNEMPDLYSLLLDNKAYSQFKLGINKELPGLFYKALDIRKDINAKTLIVLSKIHLSEYYASIGKSVLAIKFAEDALELSHSTSNPRDILASLKQATVVNPEMSSEFQRDYIRISDSIQQVESYSQQKFARLQLQTDDIQDQNKKLESQNRNLIYFFIATMLIGLLLFVIRSQRARNRELIVKQLQQKANEDIYNLMISQQALVDESRVQEKQRIAQELHDGVLGRLFGARMNLDSLNRQSDDESVKNRLNYIAELKNIEQDIREISHDLSREKVALIHNFTAIVSNLIEEQQSSFPAEISISIDSGISWQSLSNAAKINLYRILQESLQNINKYAVAKHIVVRFDKHEDTVILSIIDDGAGFEVNQRKKGIGLQNMLSRVTECGGILDIKSKKGKGTAVTVTIPIVSLPTLAEN